MIKKIPATVIKYKNPGRELISYENKYNNNETDNQEGFTYLTLHT